MSARENIECLDRRAVPGDYKLALPAWKQGLLDRANERARQALQDDLNKVHAVQHQRRFALDPVRITAMGDLA